MKKINKLMFFAPVFFLFTYIYLIFIQPIYNPYGSIYRFGIDNTEHGMVVTTRNTVSGSSYISVPSEIDYYNFLDSCYYIISSHKITPLHTGECPESWCSFPEGFFIVDKRTSEIVSGLSGAGLEEKINSMDHFGLGGGGIIKRYGNRLLLSSVCPVYEFIKRKK